MIDSPIVPPVGQDQRLTLNLGGKQFILQVPNGLEKQPNGALINATVARVETRLQGILQLQASPDINLQKGELAIRSNIPLEVGAKLQLRITQNTLNTLFAEAAKAGNKTAGFEAQIVNINGKPPGPVPDDATQVRLSSDAPKTAQIQPDPNLPRDKPVIRAVLPKATGGTTPATDAVPQQTQAKAPPDADTLITQLSGSKAKGVVISANTQAPSLIPPSTSLPQAQRGLAQQVQSIKAGDALQVEVTRVRLPLNNPVLGAATAATPQSTASPQATTYQPTPAQTVQAAKTPPASLSATTTVSTATPSNITNISGQSNVPRSPASPPASPPQSASKTAIPPASTGQVAPPQTTPQAQTSPVTFPAFQAVVIGTEQSGEVVVKSDIGTLKLLLSEPVPRGTTLTLQLQSLAASGAGNSAQPTPSAPLFLSQTLEEFARHFAEPEGPIQQLAQFIKQIDTSPQQNLLKQTFPNGQQQVASKLLWFLGGVQSGSVERFVGSELHQRLASGQPELLNKLEQVFTNLRLLSQEPNANGWQSYLFPILHGEDVSAGRIYVRKEKEDGEKKGNKKQGDTRFIVEVTLEEAGPLQLDGFVRQRIAEKLTGRQYETELELQIRSYKPMTRDMQHGIYEVFQAVNETTGLKGSLAFQVVEHFPVDPDGPTGDDHEQDVLV